MTQSERRGPIAAVMCPSCEISDTADVFFVKDYDNTLICTVLRCVVCEYLHLVIGGSG